MEQKELYLLLNVIRQNGDIKRLVREGISYKQIAELTNEAIIQKLVTYKEDKIELSDLGNAQFEQIKNFYKRTNKNEWIEIDKKNEIVKWDKNKIFIPRQNELTF
jgi:hypothetical protein